MSVLRPSQKPNHVGFETFVLKNGTTVAAFQLGKFTATEAEVDQCGAGDKPELVFQEAKVGDGVSTITCYRLSAGGVMPVLVGTGGATRGSFAECGATGTAVNRTLGGGTTVRHIAGTFDQGGVAGDVVGLSCSPFDGVSA